MSYIGNEPFSVAFLTDTFSGNGSTTAFTLSAAPAGTSSILVAISGVVQDPSTYSVVGTTLTFSPAPPTGTGNISVRFLGIPASGVTTTAYRTVTEFTATAGQTTFSVPSYTPGFIDVYRNGVMLGSADYTASNGVSVVLASGATAGDLVEVISFNVSSVLNAVQSTGTTFSGNVLFASGNGIWNTSGNVGIGNASPTFGLVVEKDNGNGYSASFRRNNSDARLTVRSENSVTGLQGVSSDGSAVTNILLNASGGNVGIGTNSPAFPLDVAGAIRGNSWIGRANTSVPTADAAIYRPTDNTLGFSTANTERMRIDSSGNVGIGCVPTRSAATTGLQLLPDGAIIVTRPNDVLMFVNRLSSDGQLIQFRQDTVEEGNISVSGTTVSYNGGHLSRYAQTLTPMDDSLLKGTVLSNLDEMNEYVDVDGNPVDNEQLNKVKVSDVEGDVNVAGVFVNWSHDTPHDVDEINMAMTGDMIIRIAEGVVVQKGDLLMSAGDGTAKPQDDDIVRSKTIAKVTSNHVTCTYEDGSYCVPCVLMAC